MQKTVIHSVQSCLIRWNAFLMEMGGICSKTLHSHAKDCFMWQWKFYKLLHEVLNKLLQEHKLCTDTLHEHDIMRCQPALARYNYHPPMRVFSHVCLCVCLSVCLSVCVSVQAITFELLHIETFFLVWRYIFTISRSHLSIKVIGPRLSSHAKEW